MRYCLQAGAGVASGYPDPDYRQVGVRIVEDAVDGRTDEARTVIVDVAVDQGGCVETIRPTDYGHPTSVEKGVVHFGVTNMPGAVPRTSSQALSSALLPWVLRLAGERGLAEPTMRKAINIAAGRVVHPAVAEALA